jgi:two-component system chemotaxis response regulator CheB
VQQKIKVLVVDDSNFVTSSISRTLSTDSEIEVIGYARNGIEAVEKITGMKPDVVTLDVVMPTMDGLTALGHIMSECPTPVIMLSALTSEGADITIKALELGAVDFFLKASALNPAGTPDTKEALIQKIKAAARPKSRADTTNIKPNGHIQLKRKARVLVVDDSGFVRSIVSRRITSDPDIEVIDVASNGIEAIKKVKTLKPDVVTLDVVMPEMDGLTALQHIMTECPVPVIMLSALTGEGTETAIRALELGAVDFYLKSSALNPLGSDNTTDSLINKIKIAAKTKTHGQLLQTEKNKTVFRKQSQTRKRNGRDKVLIIGTSTGGPRALMQVIPLIPADIPAPILIVQHMPPVFTKSLAERMNEASQIEVKEAQAGDELIKGRALVAPGNYHMTVTEHNCISLNQEPTEQGVRPAVNVTMRSVAVRYGASSIGIVLTGMGSDGTDGARHIKTAGGKVIVEDQSTCAIYGMPKSIVDSGYADKIVPLHNMASEIEGICAE